MNLSRLHQLREETEHSAALMDALRPRFDGLASRHENGTAPRAVSAFNLFQTPQTVARQLVGLLDLREFDTVLEPSAGLGRLLAEIPDHANVTAVEQSADCIAELHRSFPLVNCLHADFLNCTPEELGTFDAVAMNPPFKMRTDIRHIQHALKFLRPGGRLAAICMAGPKREDAFRDLADVWQPLPAGTFRSEGTATDTILFSIRA